jgi:hypothetical protein
MTLAVGLVLALPEIGVVTWKLYSPKLASAPCPGTGSRMPSHAPESDVNVIVSRVPSGVVITRLGGTEVSSPVKHSVRATNLCIVKAVSELPAATVTHGGGVSELLNRPAITEFGRYGLDGWVVAGRVVAGWVGLLDLGVTFWDGVPGGEVTDWVWVGDPEVAAEAGALVESDGAG